MATKIEAHTTTTLYKRDTKGKVREWTIERDGDRYRVIAGLKDGEMVTSEWTYAQPKNVGRANETSGEEQAALEVASEITKKKEKNYVENVDNIDSGTFKSPMLAEPFDDYGADLEYPVSCQPKLDGIRCLVSASGATTRNNKPIVAIPHIVNALKELFETVTSMDPNMYKFDGELYNHEFKDDFSEICSIVKQKKPTQEDLEKSAKFMQYWIYDLDIEGLPFSERSFMLEQLLSKEFRKKYPFIKIVPTTLCKTKKELDAKYEEYLQEGYEGQMVRVNESTYWNKRVKFLLKRKEFQDGEWLIDQCYEGVGNRAGTLGRVTICDLKGNPVMGEDGKQAKAQPKGGMKFYRQLWADRDQLHGKEITIRYFGLGKTGAPRFPYFSAVRDYE